MSADEAALREDAYRAQTAANLDARSAVEAAVVAAEKEASEFVEENATEYRKLKVLFARKEMKFARKKMIGTPLLSPGGDGGASEISKCSPRRGWIFELGGSEI